MSECRCCHQPVDPRPLTETELLAVVDAGLLAAGVDADPYRVVDGIALADKLDALERDVAEYGWPAAVAGLRAELAPELAHLTHRE